MSESPNRLDGPDAPDLCHREMLFPLGKLSALVAQRAPFGADSEGRALARRSGPRAGR